MGIASGQMADGIPRPGEFSANPEPLTGWPGVANPKKNSAKPRGNPRQNSPKSVHEGSDNLELTLARE